MRILVVDDSDERGRAVVEALDGTDCVVVGQVHSSAALHDVLKLQDVDVVIASMSSPDRDTLESFRTCADENTRAVVMSVAEGGGDMASEAVCAGVSAYIVGGFSSKRVRSVLEVAILRFREFHRLKGELEKSKAALADRKVIDRAKDILMEQRGLTEVDAYTLLRKTAVAQIKRSSTLPGVCFR